MNQTFSIIDFTSDTSKQLYRKITEVYGMPAFVKSAEAQDSSDVNNLPGHLFADPIHKKFPCHTKAATWLSAAYFYENKNNLDRDLINVINTNLTKFARFWNINNEIEALNILHTGGNKTASLNLTDKDYALTIQWDGQLIQKMPIINAESVKMASQYLMDNKNKYPYEWRKQAAQNILNKAEELKVSLADNIIDYLQKAAGLGFNNKNDIINELLKRANLVSPEVSIKLIEIGKVVLNNNLTSHNLHKLANLLDKCDSLCGLHNLYSKGISTPEEVLFNITIKAAEQKLNNYVKLTTGNFYKKADLAEAGLNPFKVLDEETCSQLTDISGALDINKVATILPTLPRTDALLLEKALAAANIKPE